MDTSSSSSSIVELLAKKQQVEILKRIQRLKESDGLKYYRPHKKQELFHSCGDRKYRYVRTGNRFGKSDMGAAEDCAWALGARTWLKREDENYQKGIPSRPTKGLVITVDWDKATEIFTSVEDGLGKGKFFKFLPKNKIVRVHKNHSGSIDKIVVNSFHGGNSTIYFDTVKSFNMDGMGQESSNWDWIHVDEPIPENMWKAVSRGLMDTNGKAWFACTPLSQPWINDLFLPSMTQKLNEDDVNEFGAHKIVIVGTSFDNPYLTEESIEHYLETLTEDEKQCRIYGIPLAMAGMVYKEFSHNRHILREVPHGWKSFDDPPEDYAIYYAIDPHPRTPHAVLFCAVAPTGQAFFFNEIFAPVLIDELCDMIHAVVDGRHVVRAICDPIAYIEDPIDKTCWADVFLENGIYFEKATKDLSGGIAITRQALKDEGRLYFMEELRRTVREFEHYCWDERKPGKPIDKDDHLMECLYRLVYTGLDYFAPPPDVAVFVPQVALSRGPKFVDNTKLGRF